ncbi:Glutathione hydrolase 1 proenzyme [Taenia crassiceps]|uniref:Glutathione hydrolase 1 proenzyme n=1 Tax=Taenia crassiceps TaxID=6207 RepID=A0ABR4QRU6_9CEST
MMVCVKYSRGRRYYCDYCDTSFPDSLVNRRNHLNGARHVQLRLEYMHQYRDPVEVLAAERCKRPCATYQRTGACQYGVACRYSHLTREEEACLQAAAEPVQDPMQAVWELEELLRRRRNGLRALKLPKGFRVEDLPPSVRQCLDKGNADDVVGFAAACFRYLLGLGVWPRFFPLDEVEDFFKMGGDNVTAIVGVGRQGLVVLVVWLSQLQAAIAVGGDREYLVDPPLPPLSSHYHSRGLPHDFETHESPNSVPDDTTKKGLCGDPSSTPSHLRLIYISIAACLAAISVALLITIFFGRPQVTPHGFLVSEFGPCSEAGKQIMVHHGGNAVDALVSIVLCLATTRPDIISLGGCGVFWVHKRDTDSNDLFDAMCTSPSTTDQAISNAAYNVSVPGLVAGLKTLHDAHGYLYWADLFHPAIEVAHNGFLVHPNLLKNLEKATISNPPLTSFARDFLKSVNNGSHGPQPELEATLHQLATKGSLAFYNGSIGQNIVAELQQQNVSWQLERDLASYQVQRPKHVELGLAGFSVRSFPSPFVGGILTTTVLANLDILNHQRPLNALKLARGDTSELALVYHRLIELTKIGAKQVSLLGDPYNPTTGKKVVDQEKKILSLENRKKTANAVRDDRLVNISEYGSVNPILFAAQDTNTFVLSVESDMLIAAASLTLGGAFGSGIVVSGTGILLNSAQRLFSPLEQGGVNGRAPGHRPLLPVSPVFFETAQQKCGHRFVAASSGGIQGMISLSQVLTSSFLYLSNVACTGQGDKGLPSAEETTATYAPAVGACLPLNDSLNLKRFALRLRHTDKGEDEFDVLLEPGFSSDVMVRLSRGLLLILKKEMKARPVYLEQRRRQLLEDNIREDRTIRMLTKKLGLHRRKPRKLDLLDFKKHDSSSAKDTFKGGILGESKTELRKSRDIYGQDVSESDGYADDVVLNESNGVNVEEGREEDEGNETLDKSNGTKSKKNAGIEEHEAVVVTSVPGSDEETDEMLRRSIRRLLNCVSESQMTKAISELVNIFSDRPCATVRQVFIEELDILLGSFPLNRDQSVAWLQQELAACFTGTQARLDHSGQDSRLVVHFVEFFVSSRLPAVVTSDSLRDSGGALASRCLFVTYLYRFGGLTGDFIMDCLEEFIKSGDLLGLQIAHQMIKPVSSVLRRELHERCNQLVTAVRETLATLDSSDFEKAVELEAIVTILSSKHSKEPALFSADHFVKMMKNWNKGVSFPKDSRLPLRLDELRKAKDGKGRWWAVGSAFTGDALKANLVSGTPAPTRQGALKSAPLSPELTAVATRLGLITPMRQQLFGVLVSTPGGPESTASALVLAAGASGSGSRAVEHREREMVQIVMHCLVSEQPFNRFYTRVLGALLNHHRRFAIMVRCAFWDVMAKEELTKESKTNAGKAIGILSAVYDFPLTVLKKFNFGDESEANVALLSAVVIELTTTAFRKTLEKFAYVASRSPKLGRNLRIFMRRLCKSCPNEACRSYLGRLVSELRDLFP